MTIVCVCVCRYFQCIWRLTATLFVCGAREKLSAFSGANWPSTIGWLHYSGQWRLAVPSGSIGLASIVPSSDFGRVAITPAGQFSRQCFRGQLCQPSSWLASRGNLWRQFMLAGGCQLAQPSVQLAIPALCLFSVVSNSFCLIHYSVLCMLLVSVDDYSSVIIVVLLMFSVCCSDVIVIQYWRDIIVIERGHYWPHWWYSIRWYWYCLLIRMMILMAMNNANDDRAFHWYYAVLLFWWSIAEILTYCVGMTVSFYLLSMTCWPIDIYSMCVCIIHRS